MENTFSNTGSQHFINRINQLSSASQAHWGKMSVAQMLAHCSVTYEMAFSDKHPKPNAFMRFMMKTFIKPAVVGTKPYPKNSRTAPQFIIKDDKNFELEKQKLIDYIKKTQELGSSYFEGKDSNSFGVLSSNEWNTMFAKHLDHHLSQFGV